MADLIKRRTFLAGALTAAAATSAVSVPDGVNNRIVVTGHRGRVADYLVPFFTDLGYEIIGIDKKDGDEFDLGLMQHTWRERIHPRDTIIHLAADADPNASEASVRHNNMRATTNLIQAAANIGARDIIFASSTSVSPGQYHHPTISTLLPSGWYGLSKWFGEQYPREYLEAGKWPTAFTTIRLGWIPAKGYVPPKSDDPVEEWLRSVWVPEDHLCACFRDAVERKGFRSPYEFMECIGP
jgi:GDP-D-mannose dehydratase